MSKSKTLGIIGVGQLADYFVSGLRHGEDNRPVVLGPRNARIAATLADRCGCRVVSSNQDVVEQSQVILLATRPQDAASALESITPGKHHLVISVVAGMGVDAISKLAGAATVVRSLPLFSAEVCAGALPLYPDHVEARSLLGSLGQVIVMPDEARFETAAVMGCTFSWFFRIYAQLQSWMEQAGVDSREARALALQCAHGASSLALAKPELDLAGIADGIARPGTFSLAGEKVLIANGGLSAIDSACDLVHQMLKENQ
jgi:pyrroline-5-carboxylate reductase